jgi:hypothetical protein
MAIYCQKLMNAIFYVSVEMWIEVNIGSLARISIFETDDATPTTTSSFILATTLDNLNKYFQHFIPDLTVEGLF